MRRRDFFKRWAAAIAGAAIAPAVVDAADIVIAQSSWARARARFRDGIGGINHHVLVSWSDGINTFHHRYDVADGDFRSLEFGIKLTEDGPMFLVEDAAKNAILPKPNGTITISGPTSRACLDDLFF